MVKNVFNVSFWASWETFHGWKYILYASFRAWKIFHTMVSPMVQNSNVDYCWKHNLCLGGTRSQCYACSIALNHIRVWHFVMWNSVLELVRSSVTLWCHITDVVPPYTKGWKKLIRAYSDSTLLNKPVFLIIFPFDEFLLFILN